jgi:hypothetical protein
MCAAYCFRLRKSIIRQIMIEAGRRAGLSLLIREHYLS